MGGIACVGNVCSGVALKLCEFLHSPYVARTQNTNLFSVEFGVVRPLADNFHRCIMERPFSRAHTHAKHRVDDNKCVRCDYCFTAEYHVYTVRSDARTRSRAEERTVWMMFLWPIMQCYGRARLESHQIPLLFFSVRVCKWFANSKATSHSPNMCIWQL